MKLLKTLSIAALLSMMLMPATVPAQETTPDKAATVAPAPGKETPKSDKVMAIVGKEKITEADVYSPIAMMPPQFRSRYETPEGKKKLFERSIQMSLLSQEARRLGIEKKEEVAKKIKEMSDQLIIQELTKQVISDKVTVSDAEIKENYNQNKANYIEEEKVKANLIQFEVKAGATADVKTEKKKLAEQTLKRLKKGENFEAVAKEVSDDKRTKTRGGSTGFFSAGKRKEIYGEAFEKKAFSIKPGEMSDVFEGKDGYYIVKVLEKKEQKQQTLEEVKPRIERTLKQEKQKKAFDDTLNRSRNGIPCRLKSRA